MLDQYPPVPQPKDVHNPAWQFIHICCNFYNLLFLYKQELFRKNVIHAWNMNKAFLSIVCICLNPEH